ncbi:MAG: DNA polymerase/3'-5' exonuclease PolX [Candidatus Tectomicrobia bacterium]|uniref:DNA polymerase beta n=1 Tax=Tectimicrobiota bacterium TaxID=2528274 RepID=A0A932CR73_UNCTE|nr:DNA polymerase/3'-5' exonuclease PolX [Candidatus Tectomicrobia bacterium]
MDKRQVARIFEEIGTLLEIQGESPFKSRAYSTAARTLEGLEEDLDALVRNGRLQELKGIGQALAEKITELVTTGRLEYYERLKGSLPGSLLEMLAIPTLGPKKIKAIYEGLGIKTVGELEYACHENRLVDLPGFGPKTQEKILQGIALFKRHRDRFLYSEAIPIAREILEALRRTPSVLRAEIAGSLRRRKETVKDIDLLVCSEDPGPVMAGFTHLSQVEQVVEAGSTRSRVRLVNGIGADLRVVRDEEFPFALHYFTGSQEHNIALRERARRQGIKLNEYGLFRGEKRIACRDEAEVFAALGLGFIPPELREDMGEIEAAEREELPQLIEEAEIRGVFHVHTRWSDGNASVEVMARAARDLGYQYLGIADHSQVARYARGLEPERLQAQQAEIEEANRKLPEITLLKGAEVDILPDGSLDYSEEILQGFDFAIASVHSRFNMTEEEMTRRIVRALSHPCVTMLGHPTGRLLLGREGYPIDIDAVLEAAARHGVVIELNANPHRLDLDWRHLKKAAALGVKISINPDAHSPEGLRDTAYGVGIARKGWLTREDVFNALPREEMMKRLQWK